MKIVAVEAIPLGTPWQPTAPPSAWPAGLTQVLARVTTDEGLVGWGEAFALGAPAAVCAVVHDALGPLLLVEGWLAPPSAPGLGGRPNPDVFRRHPLGAAGGPVFTTA